MNRLTPLSLLALVLTISGCGTPLNEIISLRDGTFRASYYEQAIAYCQKDGLTASMLGQPASVNGILFTCK